MSEVIGYLVIAFLFLFFVFPFLIGKEIIEDKSMFNAIWWSIVWPITALFGIVILFLALILVIVMVIEDRKLGDYFKIGDFWNARINKFKKKGG